MEGITTLKGLRANVNMSQEEVAECLGRARDSYRRSEAGERELTLDEGYQLSDLFNVPVDVVYKAWKEARSSWEVARSAR